MLSLIFFLLFSSHSWSLYCLLGIKYLRTTLVAKLVLLISSSLLHLFPQLSKGWNGFYFEVLRFLISIWYYSSYIVIVILSLRWLLLMVVLLLFRLFFRAAKFFLFFLKLVTKYLPRSRSMSRFRAFISTIFRLVGLCIRGILPWLHMKGPSLARSHVIKKFMAS